MENTKYNDLRIAEVQVLDLKALRNGDNVERRRLFDACCKDGFFYLNMSGSEPKIHTAISSIYKLEQQLFSLSENELMYYDIDKLSHKKLNGFVTSPYLCTNRTLE